MAITAETRNSIIELVVTAYDAAPGTTLLTELITIINEGGTLADVATELTTSDLWNDTYPIFQTAEEFAAEWMGKLLAEADADTLALAEDIVVGLINDGASAADLILAASGFLAELDVEDELLGSSAAGFNNKVEVATYFTVELEQDGTQDELAAAIAGVSSDEDSVDDAKEEADTVGTPGTTFTLTKDVDDITGSAGDDTITAEPGVNATTGAATTTINSGDAIDGAGGEDTLNITVTTGNNNSLSGLTVSGVEIVNITNANNLGGNVSAIADAADDVADTAAALVTAQAVQAAATSKESASEAIDEAFENDGATFDEDTVVSLANASSVAQLKSEYEAASYFDSTYAGGGEDHEYADVAEVAEMTDAAWDALEITAFTKAQYIAAAQATLTNADSSVSSSEADDADVSARAETLVTSALHAYELALASTKTDAQHVSIVDAYEDVAALGGVSIAALNLAKSIDTSQEADQVAAAYEYLEANDVNDVALLTAASTGELPAGVTTFTEAQYNAAALSTLTDDDGDSITTTVTAEAGTLETSAVTFTDMSAGQSVTVAGLTLFTTVDLEDTEVAEIFALASTGETAAEIDAEIDGEVGTVASADVTMSGALVGFDVESEAAAVVTFDSETAEGDVTDLAVSSVGGYTVTAVATDGVDAVAGVDGDAAVDARLDVLVTASAAVATNVGASLDAARYTPAELNEAIAASELDQLTGEAETVAADIATNAGVIEAYYASAEDSAAVGDYSFAEITAAASNATKNADGTSLLTNADDSAAIDARNVDLEDAAETVTDAAVTATATAQAAADAAELTASVLEATNGTVNAAQFGGSEQIWLKGASTSVDVTGATTQTIGLSGQSGMANSIAFGSASGSVYLGGSTGDLTVTGAKALSISGTTGTVDLNAASSESLTVSMSGANTLDLTLAAALESITVDGEGASKLTSVGSDVETITSTDGGVTATISTVTVIDNDSTTTDETVSATVTTSDAADTITIATSGTGTTTVSTGGGDDTIIAATRSLNARDSIDAGDGTDTIVFAGGAWAAQDYVVLDATVTGVEVGAFIAGVTADASQLGFPVIAATGGGTLTEASGAAITTWGTLTASSTGYDATDTDEIVYGGELNITNTGGVSLADGTTKDDGDATLTLNASNANVTVAATTNGSISTTINGDLETLVVTTANSAAAATKTNYLSDVTITVSATENEALTSVNLDGAGSVVINTEAAADGDIELALIDASDLGGTLATGTSTTIGNVTGGLTVTTNTFIAETVMLGSGDDTVDANSTYENMDTISGADFVKETDNGKSVTDTIILGSTTLDGSVEDQAEEVELTAGATTLGLAFVEAAAASGTDDDTVYFHFGGDTYVYQSGGNGTLDDSDLAVKIVGLVDLDTDWGVYQG